ncbi:E3 ubiquitin ligase BIG BROTHER-related-like [Malus sylvestris]|nr:E3 ubiquitin ligase BIG BROTHER-related-like [Malus domestica]XP_050159266.1 E3 ubiquitin ligase BIG BROTHER-related-like [Malus sylvestris]
MDGEEDQAKQSSGRIPFTQLIQVSADFILALAMQEQEQAYTMLETIESDSEEDDTEIDYASSSSSENYDPDVAAFLESREFDADDFRFLEDEEIGSSSSSSDQETDGLDVDELTYEEFLALGEFIGEEKRGLPRSEISACLHPYTCELAVGQSKTSIDRCVVCQLEYDDGESLAALSCEHPYHWECISQWLQIKKSCPICSTQVSSPSSSSKTMIL